MGPALRPPPFAGCFAGGGQLVALFLRWDLGLNRHGLGIICHLHPGAGGARLVGAGCRDWGVMQGALWVTRVGGDPRAGQPPGCLGRDVKTKGAE